MRIRDLLRPEAIKVNADVKTKEEALNVMIDLHDQVGNLADKTVYARDVFERESECVTAIGQGIAIPHAKSDAVRTPGLSALTVPGGLDCSALDGKPSMLFFMIAAPEDGDLHLEILSALVSLLMDPELRKRLLSAPSPEAFLEELNQAESAKTE